MNSYLKHEHDYVVHDHADVYSVFHSGTDVPLGEGSPHSKEWIIAQLADASSTVRVMYSSLALVFGVHTAGWNIVIILRTLVRQRFLSAGISFLINTVLFYC